MHDEDHRRRAVGRVVDEPQERQHFFHAHVQGVRTVKGAHEEAEPPACGAQTGWRIMTPPRIGAHDRTGDCGRHPVPHRPGAPFVERRADARAPLRYGCHDCGRGWHERRCHTHAECSDQQRNEPVRRRWSNVTPPRASATRTRPLVTTRRAPRRTAAAGTRAQDEASRQRKDRQTSFKRRVAAGQLEILGEVKVSPARHSEPMVIAVVPANAAGR